MRRTLVPILAVLSLLLAFVAIPAAVRAGGGCHNADGSVYTEGPTTVVKMDVCSFAPTIARVPVGTTVRFLNSANIDHIVLGRSGEWGSGQLAPGQEYSTAFGKAGTYPFECPLHPGMVGAIVVGDGSADVPAGGGAALGVVPSAAPSTGPNATSAPADASAAAAVTTREPDWPLIVIVGLAGLGAGAILTTLVGVAVSDRRRSRAATTN